MKKLTFALVVSLSSTAFANWVVPPAGSVYIETYSMAGSGCPAGTVSPVISNDNKTLTVSYDSYIAEVLPNSLKTLDRKNCTLTITIRYPQGYTYAIAKADYRGYVYLSPRLTAEQKATYWFAGMSMQRSYSSKFGPVNYVIDQNYLFTDVVPMPSLVWAPCGESRALVINSEIKVENRNNRAGQGIITTDSIDIDLSQQFHLSWKTCK